jgi:hypothetical protein
MRETRKNRNGTLTRFSYGLLADAGQPLRQAALPQCLYLTVAVVRLYIYLPPACTACRAYITVSV